MQSILISDQIFTLPMPPGENSAYSLRFRGPKFRCTAKHYNDTIPLHHIPPVAAERGTPTEDGGTTWLYQGSEYPGPPQSSLAAQVFLSTWDSDRLIYSKEQHNISSYETYISPGNVTEWTAFTAAEMQVCEPLSVLYDINVTFPRGIQNISYTSSDAKPLMTNSYIDTEYQGPTILYPETAEANVLEEWYQELSIFLPLTNEWTLLDALGAKLETLFYEYTLEYDSNNKYSDDNCRLGGYMENGTAVYGCSWAEGYAMNETQKYSKPYSTYWSLHYITVFRGARRNRLSDWSFRSTKMGRHVLIQPQNKSQPNRRYAQRCLGQDHHFSYLFGYLVGYGTRHHHPLP